MRNQYPGCNSAAPLECARQSPVALRCGKRLRRRGPRGRLALIRRSLPKRCRTLPGMSSGEAGDVIPDSIQNVESHDNSNTDREIYLSNLVASNSCGDGVHVFQINIQCLMAHLAELSFHQAFELGNSEVLR